MVLPAARLDRDPAAGNRRCKIKREQACKPNSVSRLYAGVATIPLGPALLPGSSDLPESCLCSGELCSPSDDRRSPLQNLSDHSSPLQRLRSGPLLLSYLVLLRVGFALPRASPPERCALTLRPPRQPAPFHPYPAPRTGRGGIFSVALSVPAAYGPTSRTSSTGPRR
jgi:hypothetical protein